MDISLNLVSSDIRKRHRLHHLAVGGLCLNLLLGLGNFYLYRSTQADLRISEERLERYQKAVREREESLAALPHRLSPSELKRIQSRVDLYNRIIEGATFSWTGLLFELERSVPANVILKEIQPDFGKNGVTLSGTAKSMEDILRCVERLKERDAFHQVYLLDHKEREGASGLQFTISLRYRGEAA